MCVNKLANHQTLVNNCKTSRGFCVLPTLSSKSGGSWNNHKFSLVVFKVTLTNQYITLEHHYTKLDIANKLD